GGEGQQHSIEEFYQAKLNFVMAELKLTESDSLRFAPLYKEYQQAKGELMKSAGKGRAIMRKMRKQEAISEAEYKEATQGELEYKLKDAELNKAWYEKFGEVLAPQQLYTLLRTEERFATEMMRKRGRPNHDNKRQGKPQK
ncbi:MAG: hypothetical protein Q4B58_00110, partial [Bacteroidales bacterium]|nr:hypothetical protein [Bacteroidales bacterium]